MSLLCILCAILAFALFALSTDQHHQQRFGTKPTPIRRRTLRRAAWVAIAACLPLAFVAEGPIYGAVFWLGALIFGAAAVFLFLHFVPFNNKQPGSSKR